MTQVVSDLQVSDTPCSSPHCWQVQLDTGLQVAHVPNAGHMIPWDDLEGFFAAFGDFLGQPLTA